MFTEFSVSYIQNKKIKIGSKICHQYDSSKNWFLLFTASEFSQLFGRGFNANKDFIGVMNGDGNTSAYHAEGSVYMSNGDIRVLCNEYPGSNVRCNYFIGFGN